MIDLAKAMTDDEVRAAAEYFAAIKWTPWVRVVETNLVPKTRISGNLFLPITQERVEPIAGRIIEVPENEEQAETYRNPHSGFVAYVPVGSIKKGRGPRDDRRHAGRPQHDRPGQDDRMHDMPWAGFDGRGDVPPIAGRSPSYMARQLFDMRQGARNGPSAS